MSYKLLNKNFQNSKRLESQMKGKVRAPGPGKSSRLFCVRFSFWCRMQSGDELSLKPRPREADRLLSKRHRCYNMNSLTVLWLHALPFLAMRLPHRLLSDGSTPSSAARPCAPTFISQKHTCAFFLKYKGKISFNTES